MISWAGSQVLALKSYLFTCEWTESCWKILNWSTWSTLLISSAEHASDSIVLICQIVQNLQMSWWGQLYHDFLSEWLSSSEAWILLATSYIYLSIRCLPKEDLIIIQSGSASVEICWTPSGVCVNKKKSRNLRAFSISGQVMEAISNSKSNTFVPEHWCQARMMLWSKYSIKKGGSYVFLLSEVWVIWNRSLVRFLTNACHY